MVYNSSEVRIGFHAKSIDEIYRFTSFNGVNLVELKPDYFIGKKSSPLYFFRNGKFEINWAVARDISNLAKERDFRIQLHMPFPRRIAIDDDRGLCQSLPEHHEIILDRFRMYAELLDAYNIGEVITVHPPVYIVNGKKIVKRGDSLNQGRILYAKLDELIEKEGFKFKVGIENMSAPKNTYAVLGFRTGHLRQLLGETKRIKLTIDTGHRLLSNDLSVKDMFSISEVVNLHFHSNPGIFSPNTFNDDKHELATPENFETFNRYILNIQRFGLPVVLEISDLENIPDEILIDYVSELRERLK